MRRARLGSATLVVLAAIAFGATPAWACNQPWGHVNTPEAGPGDPVSFEISDILPGATYEISVDGQVVQQGTDSDNAQGYQGTFTMPDLGSSNRQVYVSFVTSHDDGGPWSNAQQMTYAVPAPPPPAPQPGAEAGPEQPAQQASGSGSAAVDSPQHGGGGGSSSDGSGSDDSNPPAGSDAAGSGAPAHPAATPGSTVAPTTNTGQQAAADTAEQAERADVVRPSAEQEDETSGASPGRALEIAADAVSGETDIGVVAIPTLIVLAAALLLVLGIGGLGLLVLIARGLGPDPGDVARAVAEGYREAEIEAELQEILSEERAKRLIPASPERPAPRLPAKV